MDSTAARRALPLRGGPPLAASDLAERRLPDKLTLPATAVTQCADYGKLAPR
jgi:hypothetical protein